MFCGQHGSSAAAPPVAALPPAPTNCSACPVHQCPLQVETKTRHEIEEKKQQLRSVVGDSYRCVLAAYVSRCQHHCRSPLVPLFASFPSCLSPACVLNALSECSLPLQRPDFKRRHHHRHCPLLPPSGRLDRGAAVWAGRAGSRRRRCWCCSQQHHAWRRLLLRPPVCPGLAHQVPDRHAGDHLRLPGCARAPGGGAALRARSRGARRAHCRAGQAGGAALPPAPAPVAAGQEVPGAGAQRGGGVAGQSRRA